MTTETISGKSDCTCDGVDWEKNFEWRGRYDMCLCCGALIEEARLLAHPHVTRFSDVVALPRREG